MNHFSFKFWCVFLMISFTVNKGYAQVKGTVPSPFSEKELVSWDYSSKAVGEDYTIYIHFPPGYDTTKTKYPVLYMTDGDWNMTVAMNCFRMLRQDYTTHEPLIVGIGYGSRANQRMRDLDPGTGGARFLAFIQQEVMPFIESKYRVTNEKGLYGYSMGGMFTTYVLFEHPDLFNEIFIGAPGNSGHDLMPEAQKYFSSHHDLKAKVFLGVGSYEHNTEENIREFKAYMDKQNCKSLELFTAITPNAGHGVALAQVMQNGMAYVYCERHKPMAVPVASLQKYVGTYASDKNQSAKFKVYLENGLLYIRSENPPVQLVPFTKDGFFMYENEKMSLFYKEENNKKYFEDDARDGRMIKVENKNDYK